MAQNTSNLWALLCEELEAPKVGESAAEHSAAARKFEEAAKHLLCKHPERLRDALEIAGDVHQAAEAKEDARRCFEEALAVENPPAEQRARLSTKLALLAEARGDAEEARRHYTTAVQACEKTPARAQLPTLLNNLAGLHRACGDFSLAEKTYERALAAAVAVHGPAHPEVALVANNYGVACTDHGDFAKAENLHLRALQIREEVFGSNHPDVGQSLANLAVVYHAKRLYAKAERFYRSAIETLLHFYGPSDPQLQNIQANYDRLPQIHARNLSKTTRL
jgi:tetratricopeptide (TPR) repeat protein